MPTDKELSDTYWEAYHASKVRENQVCHYAALRAVLDKHCPTASSPIPVTERLPEAADCDSEGMCWLTTTETGPGWVLDNPEQCTGWTHWLPFQSLPSVK